MISTNRRSGRTTRILLSCLLRALKNPGCRVAVVDHHETHLACRFAAMRLQEMIHQLGLKGLIVEYHNNHFTVTFTGIPND